VEKQAKGNDMWQPVIFDIDGWARLSVDATPEHLRVYGPCVLVDIQGITQSTDTTPKIEGVVALFDTGAGHSCISPALAARLGIPSHSTLKQYAAGTEPQDTQLFRCILFFPGITQVTADFAILSHLKEPHEVVIGCDILHSARLIVDFTTGQWEAHFKIPGL
jgi:predicted aspartyl protease